MKKNTPLIKVLLVATIVAVLGYIGLDVPKEYIEDAVDTQFESLSEQSDKITVQTYDGPYPILSVIDGDTVQLQIDGQQETIRVLGIDTPETEHSSRGAECYGAEASAYAQELLADTSVHIQTDSSQDMRDKYDRVLAYIQMEDGTDFGEVMITQGYAEEFTFIKPYQNQKVYRDAEKSARFEKVGQWGECDR